MIRLNFILYFLVLSTLIWTSCKKQGDTTPPDNTPNDTTGGKTPVIFNPNLAYGTMTDQEGNVYKTIKIGNQIWMAENLRTTKYNDGVNIPNVKGDQDWMQMTSGGYCNPENMTNPDSVTAYGRLYNWFAVNTGKLAPAGWHVPTFDELDTLYNYTGGQWQGEKLRETGYTHWSGSKYAYDEGTNETGFTAIPGGYRRQSDGSFSDLGFSAFYWSSTSVPQLSSAYILSIANSTCACLDGQYTTTCGLSIRCVKDNPVSFTVNKESGDSPLTVQFTLTTPDALNWNWNFGDGTFSAEKNPVHTFINTSTLVEKTYTISLTCRKPDSTLAFTSKSITVNKLTTLNGLTTAIFNPNLTYGTMTDADGNVYKTIRIGNQTWMAENLRTTKYNDGSNIPNFTVNTFTMKWGTLTEGAYCNYGNTTDAVDIATNGSLYNGYAVLTGKLAPAGWHIPTEAEWNTLVDFLGGRGVAGGKMKETGTTHWSFNEAATNESGFTALPAGYRDKNENSGYAGFFGGTSNSRFWTQIPAGVTSSDFLTSPQTNLSPICRSS